MKKIISLLLTGTLLIPQAVWAKKSYETQSTDWEARSDKAEHWTFTDIPHHLVQDVKYSFFSRDGFLIMTLALPLVATLQDKDHEIQDHFYPSRPFGKTFDSAMNISTHPITLGSAALLTLGISELAHWEKASVTSGTMLEALVVSEALTMGLKYATNRTRPDGTSHSFPSAHSTGAFALASVAQVYYGPWVGIPAYAVASLAGLSRMDANKHFASDVAAGAVLGTLIGLGTAKYHKKIFSKVFLLPEYDPSTDEVGFKVISPF